MELPFKMIVETEMEKYRAETFWTKEPETIEWIKSFEDGDTFFDVGANVGIYSLYCAVIHPKCKIVAFEADKKNFYRLADNMLINSFENILPLNWIVSNRTGRRGFQAKSKVIGSSGGQMREKGNIQSFKIDCSIGRDPTHIKIDIDGQELMVVRGMKNTLKNKNLKSVLIEINGEVSKEILSKESGFEYKQTEGDEIIYTFLDNGFTTDNPFNKMENHSRVRRAKEGIKAENIIFTRRQD